MAVMNTTNTVVASEMPNQMIANRPDRRGNGVEYRQKWLEKSGQSSAGA
jgi:hypothetical protein